VTPTAFVVLSPRVATDRYNPAWGALVDQFWLH
jgi:hypothetical protein